DGHPNPQMGVPFFDAATGSLGQGLSVAAGLASAARMDKLDRNFYCIIGDGESREGQNWEAADFVVDHALTNITQSFDCNGSPRFCRKIHPKSEVTAMAVLGARYPSALVWRPK